MTGADFVQPRPGPGDRLPRLALAWRLGGVCLLTGSAGYLAPGAGLCAALGAALGFRWLCGCGLEGLGAQLRACAVFALAAGLLGVPHATANGLLWQTLDLFSRLSVALLPALAFSATLDTREVAWSGRRWVPPAALLAAELALRFAPVLAREALEVLALQRARGAYRRGPLRHRIQALLLPFFARVFHLADRVTHVLRTRGVEPHRRRVVVPPDALRRALRELKPDSTEVSDVQDARADSLHSSA